MWVCLATVFHQWCASLDRLLTLWQGHESWWSYCCQASPSSETIKEALQGSFKEFKVVKLAFLLQFKLWTKGIQGRKNFNSVVAFCSKRSEFYLTAIQGLVTAACIGQSILQNSRHLQHNMKIQIHLLLNHYKYKTKIQIQIVTAFIGQGHSLHMQHNIQIQTCFVYCAISITFGLCNVYCEIWIVQCGLCSIL